MFGNDSSRPLVSLICAPQSSQRYAERKCENRGAELCDASFEQVRKPSEMKKFKAFISYKHMASSHFAENLELSIKAYAKPIYRPPIAVFRDEKYLKPGLDLPQMIRNALDESEYLIYLASPEAAASEWVHSELEQWCADATRCERLIVILTDGHIGVDTTSKQLDWSRTNALPASLSDKIIAVPFYIDLAWANEPQQQTLLNPDYKKAINKVVARLRDVDPIVLSGEEILQHRRNLRIRNAFIGTICGLALLLAGTAWFAWQQMLEADARARESTSRRLAAEADRIAEDRVDTALLLMAQAFHMGSNTALRESWWRLLGSAALPETYLPTPISSLKFEPDGRLAASTENGEVMFALQDTLWNAVVGTDETANAGSEAPITWEWSGGCEQGLECDEAGVWECARYQARSIGPYGDTDDFCVASRIHIPGWCGDTPVELNGFDVSVRRVDDDVQIQTDMEEAYFACVSETEDWQTSSALHPILIAGTPGVFSESITSRIGKGGPRLRWLSRSMDGRWLAVVREGEAAELWQLNNGLPVHSRRGVERVALPVRAEAIAASRSGSVAVGLAPSEPGGIGTIAFWKHYQRMLSGQSADLIIEDGWRTRGRLGGILEVSPLGDRIVAGADVEISLWDGSSGHKSEPIWIGREAAIDASISADARLLAVQLHPLDGALDPPPKIFAFQGKPEQEYVGQDASRALSFSPETAGMLATAGAAGVETHIIGHADQRRRLVMDAAELVEIEARRQLIGVAAADGSLLVRSLDETGEVFRSGRRDSATTAIAFHAQDDMILRSSHAALEAWDWPSNAWLTVSASAHRKVVSLPDGSAVALSDQGEVLFYQLNPARWLTLTCGIVGRNLSREEWLQHIGESFRYECACPDQPPGRGWPQDACQSVD